MGPSAFELAIFVLARVEPRTLLPERLVARKLVRCNTDGDRVADDAQGHMFVRPPPKTSHGGARPEDPAEGPRDAKPVRLTIGAQSQFTPHREAKIT